MCVTYIYIYKVVQKERLSLRKLESYLLVMLSLKYRNVAHFSESYLRSVSSKTTSDFEQSVNTQTQKFTEFEVSFCEVTAFFLHKCLHTVKTFGLLQPHFRLSELHQCDQGMLPNRFLESSLRSIFSSVICFENVIVLAWYTMRQRCLVELFYQLEKQF